MTDRGISFQNSIIYEIPRNQLYRVSCNPCLISYVKTLLRFSRIYARKLLGRYSPFCLSIVPKSNVCTTAKNVLFAEWKFIISTLLQLFGWLYVRRNIFKIATLSFTSSPHVFPKSFVLQIFSAFLLMIVTVLLFFSTDFICEYELSWYPFDTQETIKSTKKVIQVKMWRHAVEVWRT